MAVLLLADHDNKTLNAITAKALSAAGNQRGLAREIDGDHRSGGRFSLYRSGGKFCRSDLNSPDATDIVDGIAYHPTSFSRQQAASRTHTRDVVA